MPDPTKNTSMANSRWSYLTAYNGFITGMVCVCGGGQPQWWGGGGLGDRVSQPGGDEQRHGLGLGVGWSGCSLCLGGDLQPGGDAAPAAVWQAQDQGQSGEGRGGQEQDAGAGLPILWGGGGCHSYDKTSLWRSSSSSSRCYIGNREGEISCLCFCLPQYQGTVGQPAHLHLQGESCPPQPVVHHGHQDHRPRDSPREAKPCGQSPVPCTCSPTLPNLRVSPS